MAKGQESKAGQTTKVDLKSAGGGHYLLYLPTNYTEDRKWPVIFYFHGMNGSSNVERMKTATGSKNFIIVGMEYVHRGENYSTTDGTEMASLKSVAKDLLARVKADESTFIVAGFSKGGWVSAAIMEDVGKDLFAGAMILAGGRNSKWGSVNASKIKGLSFYIGNGEKDGNRPAGEFAAREYRKAGANVTLEIYAGKGHGLNLRADALREWLKFFGETKYDPPAIREWLASKLKEAESQEHVLDCYEALKSIPENPHWFCLDAKEQKRQKDAFAKIKMNMKLRRELKAMEEYQKLSDDQREADSCTSSTKKEKMIKTLIQKYRRLETMRKGTRGAEKAAEAYKELTAQTQ
jgi:predicted esterase